MKKAILGKKLGMTQIFTPDGVSIPVTVVEAGPCTVTQIKTMDKDGYEAVQVAFVDTKEFRLSKAEMGHLKKANSSPKKVLREFRFESAGEYEVGKEISCGIFKEGEKVDVVGLSKGRGFSGVIQRWNQARLRMTHGTGPVHREVGSMGANSSPSRVFKGKHLPGQWGHERITIQNLEVVKVDTARNVLLIRGGIPGPKGGLITVKTSIKG